MGCLRRPHLLALGTGAALLLLMLPRPPPPRPAPAPLIAPDPPPSPTQVQTRPPTSSPATVAPADNRTEPAKPPAPAPVSVLAATAAPAAPTTSAAPAYVVTGSIYEAGHSVPHPELCPNLGAKLRLVVLISSAPSHAAARDAVRLTWGHYARRSDLAIAFVLGAPPASLRPALAREDALYGDLIIGNSIDSYSNLTLKTLSMLEWADSYCPRAPLLLKTDDDMFINVPRLLTFAAARANTTKTIWGNVMRKLPPIRDPNSKSYLSPGQYPGRVLPDFTSGCAYLITRDAVPLLLAAAPPEPYVRVEDVFVTGVLANKLGLRRTHAPEFYNECVAMAPHPCAVHREIAIHMVRYHEQFDLWRKLLDGKTKCSS